MLLTQGLIFPFYSSVIAASSDDHPETKKAKRSLDNLEVHSFFIFLFTESYTLFILYYTVDMLAGMLTDMVDMLTISHYID